MSKLRVLLMAVLALAMLAAPAMSAPRHGYYRGWHNGGGWHDGRGWHNGGGWHNNPVPGVIGGIIIGNAISRWLNPAPPIVVPSGPTVEWCMQRYRSYNPETHTYLGYDGQVHGCP